MDVRVNTEVKGFGVAVAPAAAMERADRMRAPVTPVGGGGESSRAALGDKELHSGAKPAAVDAREIAKAVEEMQQRLDSLGNTRLNLRVEEKANEVVVQITDRMSGELVRQFPTEEALSLMTKLRELTGLLFDEKA